MSSETLKQALNACKINFDRRVLVTDLLEQYKLPYKEVHETLQEHLKKEEESAGIKFVKRFMVHGEEQESNNEIYTIVQGETKLKEWLNKLSNTESMLYSVEVASGAKAMPADIFKPMQHCALKIEDLELRTMTTSKLNGVANGSTRNDADTGKEQIITKKSQFKTNTTKKSQMEPPPSSLSSSSNVTKDTSAAIEKNAPNPSKKSPEEAKKSAAIDQKSDGAKKASNINNFFGPTAKTSEPKKRTKPSTPKKMQDYFKKQTEKVDPSGSAAAVKKSPPINTSVQVFDVDSDEAEVHRSASESSDEEEKLDKIRREIMSTDADSKPEPSTKRRRIIDSEDEEPPQKFEKEDVGDNECEVINMDLSSEPNSEAYLDEDGFVITIKNKKGTQANKNKKIGTSPSKSATKKSPGTKSTSSSGGGSTSKTTAPAAKTKQGNIMNFFKKK